MNNCIGWDLRSQNLALRQDSSFSQFKSTYLNLPTRGYDSFSELCFSETDKNYTQNFKASVNDPNKLRTFTYLYKNLLEGESLLFEPIISFPLDQHGRTHSAAKLKKARIPPSEYRWRAFTWKEDSSISLGLQALCC